MKTFDPEQAPIAPAPPRPSVSEPSTDVDQGPGSRPVAGGLAFAESTPPTNGTGLPDDLRAGVEQLSGLSLDDVTVHHSSPLPAQVGAHAFTQGREIHLGPGEEEHLPHEAWHVVQQAQGRVRPTMQLKGARPVNDDRGLEREADVMGARALRSRPSKPGALTRDQLGAAPAARGIATIQLVKFVAKPSRGGVTISAESDDYKLKKGKKQKERLATREQTEGFLLGYKGDDVELLEMQRELKDKRSEQRKQRRTERRLGAAARRRRPQGHEGKQVEFPVVLEEADTTAALVYRGMSVNNINNMLKEKSAIFSAQTPTGTATPIEHIVDDSETSPYLSFETGGLGVSAGKYAAKPVDKHNKPLGVTVKEGTGFLKQEKSYTAKSKEANKERTRLGYVGGIPSASGHLDVSDRHKAERRLVLSDRSPQAAEKREKAIQLATADKEVLVRPGTSGIGSGGVPFVAKVKVVKQDYFEKNLIHQTPTMALGFFKPFDSEPVYSKIQVIKGSYTFQIAPDLLRNPEDSENEMSDIEDMNLDDYQ